MRKIEVKLKGWRVEWPRFDARWARLPARWELHELGNGLPDTSRPWMQHPIFPYA